MKIISSELYVKDNKVYHEGNKPKPKDIGAAPETHTHNYASATTPGGSAEHAIKATEDSLGQRIDTYIKGLSVSGRTITYTRGDGTTGTITTQDNNTDTKVTNTLNTTAKAYITGTTNSATNTGTQVFDTNVYLDTTAGTLTATTFKGALQGNAATATSATSAASATQLATARTINGTSFNGTGNITTANWGTARNIQIGNSSKSVNGSSNMTWTLAEIGAAPEGHTHNYAPASHNHGLLHDNFGTTIADTTTDNGWSMINGSYNGFLLKSLRSNSNAPAWLQGNYSAGIAFGGADTKGVMSVAYNTPSVRFAGGNGSKPVWHFTVNGSSGKTYNMDSLAANTANTLATPRTINGTNFNGSANITTANWGTARTLTIGNTGKSVNGSGNVSWSIGEIGAAPASHNHTSLTGITNLSFAAEGSDSASITTTVEGANTYFDFNLSDDPSHEDMWRWRFRPSGANVFNAMTLDAISTTEAKLAVTGEVQATRLKGTLTGDVKGNVTGTVSGNAGSATKLATARTINGTNFDGTGNITTANWGTARNIQIGNAVKSVNGSGNVTWNWSEMQVPRAYSSSYNFGGNQNAITTAQFITMLTNLGAFSQVYWVSRGSWSYASNQYINDTGCGNIHLAGCVVEVIGNTSAYTIRVTTPTTTASGTTNAEFIYVNNGTDYSPGWRRQYNTKNKPTASEIGAAASSHTHNYAGSSSAGGAANTAIKLNTARTINGTSFDGSANITTSLWGTARNIQIGNTAKSVNGSANVSWSLSEIGAMPCNKVTSLDCNTIKTTSIYLVKGSPTNAGTTSHGTLKTYFDVGTPYQLWMPDNVNTVYKRTYNTTNAAWNGWSTTFTNSISGNAATSSKWATARTFTIGNTGKSVDGSGNVSWSLSEIGAAASSHSHNAITSRGNVTAESGVSGRPAVAGLSMSEAYNNGYPTPYGNIINLRGTGDGQILVGWSGTDGAHAPIYVRSKRDNTSTANWSGWAQIYTTANKPTAAEIGAASTAVATTSANGLMSKADKSKLDSIATNAQFKMTVASGSWAADGSLYSTTINHNLNKEVLYVSAYDSSSKKSIFVSYTIINNNSLKVTVESAINAVITIVVEGGLINLAAGGISDSTTAANTTWSSTKIQSTINAAVKDGTTSQKGIVQLSSATNSTSTALAATASAVKAAYDLANTANNTANTIKNSTNNNRTITMSTANPSGGKHGDIWFKYE